MLRDIQCDPFGERGRLLHRKMTLLGARFEFDSNSRDLLALVDAAYARLPAHRLAGITPTLKVHLRLSGAARRPLPCDPPAPTTASGSTLLAGATAGSSYVSISSREREALIVVDPKMLSFPYHLRYEMLEFAVFTLAARVQGLVPLHAACVGLDGRGVLLMGHSGAGKSTVALHCLLGGFDFLSEDSVFVTPRTLLATGVANFLHVRSDSLRWLDRARASVIRQSPTIRRRSGVRKFEVDLRHAGNRLASSALKIIGTVILSSQPARGEPLLRRLPRVRGRLDLAAVQPYAARQPQWPGFIKSLAAAPGVFELRRGAHPRHAVDALKSLLGRA